MKQKGLVRRIVSEMMGKVSESNSLWSRYLGSFFRPNITVTDYDRNDYDLFRSIYYNSCINGKGDTYQLVAALGKPIVNITAGFVIGRGVKIELENAGSNNLIQEAENEINEWVQKNERHLFNVAKRAYRDGDAYIHIDEFGRITDVDAKGVEVMIDPISGRVIGADVLREVDIVESSDLTVDKNKVKYVYVKQYRTDSIRIYRYKANSPNKPEILWERVYTNDGAVEIPVDEETGEQLGVPASNIRERLLPLKMYHNEPEAEAVYGNSDYQNLLSLFEQYSSVIREATRGVKYNAVPIPILIGVKDPSKADANDPATSGAGQTEQKEGVSWGQDRVIYIDSEKGDAKMLQGNSFMGDVSSLLQLYFYLIVQGSETPEFSFGTAVTSSKASTQTQEPILSMKIVRKQQEFAEFIQDMVNTYVERRILMSDPVYLPLKENMPTVRVIFPPIADEDKSMTLSAAQWGYENGILTAEKVIELTLGDKIKDIPEEVKNAVAEAQKKNESSSSSSDRLVRDLLNRTNQNNQQNNGGEANEDTENNEDNE